MFRLKVKVSNPFGVSLILPEDSLEGQRKIEVDPPVVAVAAEGIDVAFPQVATKASRSRA
jgi:hypothetical protein